jgi:hypothetical protein
MLSGSSPLAGVATTSETRQPQRHQAPVSRPVGGSTPVVRPPDGREGRTLPRAYVARRRLSPRNTPIVPSESVVDRGFRAPAALELRTERSTNSTKRIESDGARTAAVSLASAPNDAQESVPTANALIANDVIEAIEKAVEPIESTDSPQAVALDEPTLEQEFIEHPEFYNSDTEYAPAHSVMATFQSPLNARHVVLIMLAVVAVAIAVSATVAIFVERRTTSSVTAPASNH